MDNMIEDGFDDPSDYLDYLCAQSELEEMRRQEEENFYEFTSLPRFVRKEYEPFCPICGNDLKIYEDGLIRCQGFPACKFEKTISFAKEYIAPENRIRSYLKNGNY